MSAQAQSLFPKAKSIQKGPLFAIVQTIISIGFLFPYVYAPKSGFGLFSFGDNAFGTNPDHWKLPFAILLWHLLWGAILGYLYDPKRPEEGRARIEPELDDRFEDNCNSISGRVCICGPGPFAP